MPLGDKAKAALPLRPATLKQQAMITRQSGKRQASLKPALGLVLCWTREPYFWTTEPLNYRTVTLLNVYIIRSNITTYTEV